jgi:hypothetical protein
MRVRPKRSRAKLAVLLSTAFKLQHGGAYHGSQRLPISPQGCWKKSFITMNWRIN